MTYRPRKLAQKFRIKPDGTRGEPWGTPFDNSNCWATATAEAIDFATEGAVQWTPAQVRSKKTGDPRRKPGYIDPDIYDALEAAGLVNLTANPKSRKAGYYRPSSIPWDTFVRDYLPKPNFAFIIAGDYDQVPDNLAVIDSFDDGHSVFSQGGVTRRTGNQTVQPVDDPLALNVKFWPLEVLENYTKKLGRAQGLPRGSVYITRVRQALPPVVPPPPPPPPPPAETPEQAVIRLTAERDAALGQVTALTTQVDLVTAERDALQQEVADRDATLAAIHEQSAPEETQP